MESLDSIRQPNTEEKKDDHDSRKNVEGHVIQDSVVCIFPGLFAKEVRNEPEVVVSRELRNQIVWVDQTKLNQLFKLDEVHLRICWETGVILFDIGDDLQSEEQIPESVE